MTMIKIDNCNKGVFFSALKMIFFYKSMPFKTRLRFSPPTKQMLFTYVFQLEFIVHPHDIFKWSNS